MASSNANTSTPQRSSTIAVRDDPMAETVIERYLNMVRTKTVGKVEGISLIYNNMTGIGMIQTSSVFQQSGWLPVTAFFLLFMIISSLCALFVVEAMQAIPGNRYFQGNVEFGTLINFYFGSTAHILGQFGLYGALEIMAMGSIIQSSQTMDNLFIDLFGRTCGVSLGITNNTSSAIGWYCVTDHGTGISPFGNQYMLFTGGLLAASLVIVPQCIFPLADVLWVQVVTFLLTLAVFGEWIVSSIKEGLHADYVPLAGNTSGYAGLVGTVMLNYAFAQTIPAWVNVRRPDVSIQESIWVSSSAGFISYMLTGLLPALAYAIPDGSNLIAVMTTQGGIISKVFGYIFSLLALMMSVPVLLIVAKLNLDQNFQLPRGVSSVMALVVPWILSIPFLTGSYLTSLTTWGSLIFVSVANFVVPLIIFLKATEFRKSYNEHRRLTKHQRDLLKVIHGGSGENGAPLENLLNSVGPDVDGFLVATSPRPEGPMVASPLVSTPIKFTASPTGTIGRKSTEIDRTQQIPVLILHEPEDDGKSPTGNSIENGTLQKPPLLIPGSPANGPSRSPTTHSKPLSRKPTTHVVLPPQLMDLDMDREAYLLEDVPDPDKEDDEEDFPTEAVGQWVKSLASPAMLATQSPLTSPAMWATRTPTSRSPSRFNRGTLRETSPIPATINVTTSPLPARTNSLSVSNSPFANPISPIEALSPTLPLPVMGSPALPPISTENSLQPRDLLRNMTLNTPTEKFSFGNSGTLTVGTHLQPPPSLPPIITLTEDEAAPDQNLLLVPRRLMTVSSVIAQENYRHAVEQLAEGKPIKVGRMKPFRSIPKSFPLSPRTVARICLVVTVVTAVTNLIYSIYSAIN